MGLLSFVTSALKMEPAVYSETSPPMHNVITRRKPNLDRRQREDLRSTWL